MSILVVGSVAYDNLETPSGRRDDVRHMLQEAQIRFVIPVMEVGLSRQNADHHVAAANRDEHETRRQ